MTKSCQRVVIYTVLLFPSAKRRRGSNPLLTSVHLLARTSVGDFSPALLLITAPTGNTLDSHTVAAVVIFRL